MADQISQMEHTIHELEVATASNTQALAAAAAARDSTTDSDDGGSDPNTVPRIRHVDFMADAFDAHFDPDSNNDHMPSTPS